MQMLRKMKVTTAKHHAHASINIAIISSNNDIASECIFPGSNHFGDCKVIASSMVRNLTFYNTGSKCRKDVSERNGLKVVSR